VRSLRDAYSVRSILILPFHGIGHFNGLFGVARALEKTHQVVFAGDAYFNNHVQSHLFTYISLGSYPFGIGLDGWVNEKIRKLKDPWWQTVVDRWKDRLYYERKAELSKLIRELKPELVLVDTQQATDVVVLKAIDPNIKISLVSVAPPYLLIPGLPPVNSLAMPGDGDKALRRSLNAIRSRTWQQRLKYFGIDDRMIVERRLRRNDMMYLKDDYPSLISLAVKDLPQYILTYKEFDFHHQHLDRFHYVGPHVEGDRLERMSSSDRKIIYCSFGTVPSDKNVEVFIQKVNEAIKGMDVELIVGSKKNWVSQQLVLSKADLFITHGGINSVHDAIRHKVPMMVYPIDSNYDQNGNSSRVVFHGFGLRGDFDTATVDDIRQNIVRIFNDISFRKKLEAFDTSAYTIGRFIQMLLS
jgi:zeaxanthin glucosyltransferase